MKKRLSIIILSFICTVCLAFACGCAAVGGVGFEFDDFTFVRHESEQAILPKDDNINIDGVLDEDFWEERKVNATTIINKVSEDVTMTAWFHLGEMGVYCAVEVNDYAFYYNPERSPARNSSAEVYLMGYGGEDTDAFNIRIVPTGNGNTLDKTDSTWYLAVNSSGKNEWTKCLFAWEGAAVVKGNPNSSHCQGFTAEAYIPWTSLGVKNIGYIKYMIGFNHVETSSAASDSERTWAGTPGCDLIKPSTYKAASNSGLHDFNGVMDALIVKDENMNIDGKLDESEWAGKEQFVYKSTLSTGAEVEMSVKSHTSDKGVYLGFEVKDKYLYYSADRAVGLNTGLEIMMAPAGAEKIDERAKQLRIAANNDTARWVGKEKTNEYPWITDYFQVISATEINGTLNLPKNEVSDNVGYTVEMFMPWDAFGYDAQSEGILIYPVIIHNESATLDQKISPYSYVNFTSMNVSAQHNPSAYYLMAGASGVNCTNIEVENLSLSPSMLSDGNYVAEVTAYASLKDASSSISFTKSVIDADYTFPDGVTYSKEADGKSVTVNVPETMAGANKVLQYEASYHNRSVTGNIYFTQFDIDGVLDEGYGYGYSSAATAQNKQTGYVNIGDYGLYVLFDVTDGNIQPNTHLEFYFANGTPAIGSAWQVRFYPHSGVNKTYEFKTPDANDFAWKELTGEYKFSMTAEYLLTDKGYVVEAYIPYSSLGIKEKPSQIGIIPCIGYVASDGKSYVDDGSVRVSNKYVWTESNYKIFNENGYKAYSLLIDDIYFTRVDLSDGYYTKEFEVTDDCGNIKSNVYFTRFGSYINETSYGVYVISVPQSEIGQFLTEKAEVLSADGYDVLFRIGYLGDNAAVKVDIVNGAVANTGSSQAVAITANRVNGSNQIVNANSIKFVETGNADFAEGMDGDAKGAIATNHASGAYTVVKDYALSYNDFTVSAWIKINEGEEVSTGNSTYIFGNSKCTDPDGFYLTLRYSDNAYKMQFSFAGDKFTNLAQKTKNVEFTFGEWHMVTVSRKGDYIRFFFDGECCYEQEVDPDQKFGDGDISFGAPVGETWSYINSTTCYDNICIYDTGMSEGQVKALMQSYGYQG